MTADKVSVKRINAGIYTVVAGSRKFEIERFPDGSWMLFEINDYSREYWQDFYTLADAKAACASCV